MRRNPETGKMEHWMNGVRMRRNPETGELKPWIVPKDVKQSVRMRRNPETGKMEPWVKPSEVENNDADYSQVVDVALRLRERIAPGRTAPFDVTNPLDSRCMDAALAGAEVVYVADIDLSSYNRRS
jgi:hypothetical protein